MLRLPFQPGSGSASSSLRDLSVASTENRAWCTTRRLLGRYSRALMYLPSGTFEREDEIAIDVRASAGIGYGSDMVSTMSGWPRTQPVSNCGAGGRSAASPSAAPCSTQRLMSAICSAVSRRSPRNGRGPDAFPRRHEAVGRDLGDLLGPFLHVAVGEQRERRDFARMMAAGALGEDDRGDVLVEGDRRCGSGCGLGERGRE